MSKTAVGYTRLSETSNISIQNQKEHIRAYAREHGFDLLTIHDDGELSSGFKPDQLEEYQKVHEKVRAGDIDAVVINGKRRMARDENAVMRFVADLRSNGVELHTYQDGEVSLEEPMQAAFEIMRAAVAAEEKRAEIEKSIEVTKARAEDPDVDHGRPPFGMAYDESGRRWVPGERFTDAMDIIARRNRGESFRKISEAVNVSTGTAHRVAERSEFYVKRSKLAEE